MGYYTGSGVVTGGSSSISNGDSVYDGSNTIARQTLTTTTTTTSAGVSLSTAQANTSSSTMKCNNITAAGLSWATPNAYVSSTNFSYSRIADSNLYALTQTVVVNQVRLCARAGTSAGALTNGAWST